MVAGWLSLVSQSHQNTTAMAHALYDAIATQLCRTFENTSIRFRMTKFRNYSLADPTSFKGSAIEKSLAPDCLADNGQDTIPIAPVSLPHPGRLGRFCSSVGQYQVSSVWSVK
jgi:hypothetical protein